MDGAKSRSKAQTSRTSKPKKLPVKSAGRAITAPGDVAVNPVLNPEERHQMIALAAYYRAEQRGFANGDPLRDWLEAEAEVTMRLRDVEAGKPAS